MYNNVIATSNTAIIVNSVVVLFVMEIDEVIFSALDAISDKLTEHAAETEEATKMKKELDDKRKELERKMNEELEQKRAQIASLEEEIDDQRKDLEQQRAQIVSQQKEIDDQRKDLEQQKAQIVSQQKEIDDQRKDLQMLREAVEAIQESQAAVADTGTEATSNIESTDWEGEGDLIPLSHVIVE